MNVPTYSSAILHELNRHDGISALAGPTGGGCHALDASLPDGRVIRITDGDAAMPDGTYGLLVGGTAADDEPLLVLDFVGPDGDDVPTPYHVAQVVAGLLPEAVPEPKPAGVRTRRLLVTLPDASGEEADATAEQIDEALTDGFTVLGTAEHLLDEAPLSDGTTVTVRDQHGEPHVCMSVVSLNRRPDEARKLAALLLRAADEAEGRS